MSTALDGITPTDLGLQAKFRHWRKHQPRAIQDAMRDSHRFVGLCLPAGAGKSPVYIALHELTGKRTVVLTSTRGLQTQLLDDFGESNGMVDVRGKANYQCVMYQGKSCDDAADHCQFAGGAACPYRATYLQACASDLVVTNYQYWLAINRYGGLCQRDPDTKQALNPVEMLVLDEMHHTENELERFLAITIRAREMEKAIGRHDMPPEKPESLKSWAVWAGDVGVGVGEIIKGLGGYVDSNEKSAELRRVKGLLERLDQVRKLDDDWIVEWDGKRDTVTFTPIWVGKYAEQNLFRGVDKIVCVSATLRPRTITSFGVKSLNIGFHEYPCEFPEGRCPVYKVPGVKVSKKTDANGIGELVGVIDSILDGREDRKGIVQTVSYRLQQEILKKSRNRDRMLANVSYSYDGSANIEAVVKKYLEAEEPVVLVSPSLATGWDFPGTSCEFIVIAKIPFPDISSRVFLERQKRDPRLGAHIAMQTLMQSSRRGMRSKEDRCEVFVVDDNLNWFMTQNRDLAAKWFKVKWRKEVPRAPGRL